MFGRDHYVPVLKGKKGELDALNTLSPEVAQGLTPLIEVPPIAWDFVADQPRKDLTEHLAASVRAIATSWTHGGRILVDLPTIADDVGGAWAADTLASGLVAAGLAVVPVTAPDRVQEYQEAVGAVAARDGNGLCVRVGAEGVAYWSNGEVDLEESLGRSWSSTGRRRPGG